MRLLPLLCALGACHGEIIRRWPLAESLAIEDLRVDGAAAGPAGMAVCTGLNGSKLCHDPDADCNRCTSAAAPHIFWITWCADTAGFDGVTCDLDLGYRSAQGAREGRFEYALRGYASVTSDFTNMSTSVFPDSPWPLHHFAAASGKNDIITSYQLSLAGRNGDNLALSATSGFCCRCTFSGGSTVTGTLYIGDLTIRGNPRASAPGTASVSPASYSGTALGGATVGAGLLGGALAAAALTLVQYRATGALPAAFHAWGWARDGAAYVRTQRGVAASLGAARATELGPLMG